MGGEVIELELPVAVSENRYRRFAGKFPIISADGRKYQELVKQKFQRSGQEKVFGNVEVQMDFYPPDRRKRDLDNLFKCLFDSLTGAGCIEDDSMIIRICAEKREPMPPDGMIYVKIKKLTA